MTADMPRATEEQRAEWWPDEDGTGTQTAEGFLFAAGYLLTRRFEWVVPVGHSPTHKETRAMLYLIDEWDYGGFTDQQGA